jgi:hypothetical protein
MAFIFLSTIQTQVAGESGILGVILEFGPNSQASRTPWEDYLIRNLKHLAFNLG